MHSKLTGKSFIFDFHQNSNSEIKTCLRIVKGGVLGVLFFISTFSFSQNDSILPNLNGEYHIKEIAIVDWSPYFIFSSNQNLIICNQDTLNDTLIVIYESDTVATIWLDNYRAYIKRASVDPNNFFRGDFGTGYELLYDFGLNVGDTAYLLQYSSNPIVVTTVENIIIQNQNRRKLILSNNEEWIQGFGSTLHPLISKMHLFERYFEVCSGDLEYFGNSPIDMFYYENETVCSLSIDEINDKKGYTLKVFPNPTMDGCIIIEIEKIENSIDIQLIDAVGKVHNTWNFTAKSNQEQKFNLNFKLKGNCYLKIVTCTGVFYEQINSF